MKKTLHGDSQKSADLIKEQLNETDLQTNDLQVAAVAVLTYKELKKQYDDHRDFLLSSWDYEKGTYEIPPVGTFTRKVVDISASTKSSRFDQGLFRALVAKQMSVEQASIVYALIEEAKTVAEGSPRLTVKEIK